ncbi:MAG: HTH-type transcriptional regulator CynR [Candidatus Celerinatantimonas neptuna]|nr:MAG: HTH-type transcriptional regulator CynR [Candidatus Celerinatantimonas neptuna]
MLRYFVELVKQQSFTRASEKLFVTQPTISKMIKNLEAELGQPLLHRDGHRFWLTDAGEAVYQSAQVVLRQMKQLKAELNDLNQLKTGHLNVGIPPMVGHLFANLIRQYRQSYPEVELTILEYGGRKIEQAVLEGELDVAITMISPQTDKRLNTLPFVSYPIFAILPDEPRWQKTDTIRWTQLKDEPFYSYTEEFTLSGYIYRICKSAGFTPQIAARSSQWDFLVALVKSGGVAFLPQPLCQRIHQQGVIAKKISPSIDWKLGAIWHSERYLSRTTQAWLELCHQQKHFAQVDPI